ncbi:MAG: hypothetical protein OEZ32_05040 [Nitrospinota bacterium]|nr:hypothetical protein [Nitrospinota bacterium]
MMDEKRDRDLKDLSQLIVTALTKDEAVMNALADLKDRKVIEPSTLLGLALKINDLLELSGTTLTGDEVELMREKESAKEAELDPVLRSEAPPLVKTRAIIDGRQLSYEEILFEEWAIAKFNEKLWLKKAGLTW